MKLKLHYFLHIFLVFNLCISISQALEIHKDWYNFEVKGAGETFNLVQTKPGYITLSKSCVTEHGKIKECDAVKALSKATIGKGFKSSGLGDYGVRLCADFEGMFVRALNEKAQYLLCVFEDSSATTINSLSGQALINKRYCKSKPKEHKTVIQTNCN